MTHLYAWVCPRESQCSWDLRQLLCLNKSAHKINYRKQVNHNMTSPHTQFTNCHSLMQEIMNVFRRTEIFTLLWFVAKYPLSLLILLRIIFACTNISPALKQLNMILCYFIFTENSMYECMIMFRNKLIPYLRIFAHANLGPTVRFNNTLFLRINRWSYNFSQSGSPKLYRHKNNCNIVIKLDYFNFLGVWLEQTK
jgi:hypothetical protein